ALFVTPTEAVNTANAIISDAAATILAFLTVTIIKHPDYMLGAGAKLKKLCRQKSIFLLFRLIPSLTPTINLFCGKSN
ncbi:MAG TPA: hypothetical protein DD626_01345, partial [Clostridiales bacterium]|nr:hypothetical protein [Clostridiales bacterium]